MRCHDLDTHDMKVAIVVFRCEGRGTSLLLLFTKYYEGDNVKEDEISGTCSTHGSNTKPI